MTWFRRNYCVMRLLGYGSVNEYTPRWQMTRLTGYTRHNRYCSFLGIALYWYRIYLLLLEVFLNIYSINQFCAEGNAITVHSTHISPCYVCARIIPRDLLFWEEAVQHRTPFINMEYHFIHDLPAVEVMLLMFNYIPPSEENVITYPGPTYLPYIQEIATHSRKETAIKENPAEYQSNRFIMYTPFWKRCGKDQSNFLHGPLTRYVKLQVAHAPGMPGTFSPAVDFKGNRLLVIPALITARAWRTCHDACRDRLHAVTRKTFPAFPAHAHPQF